MGRVNEIGGIASSQDNGHLFGAEVEKSFVTNLMSKLHNNTPNNCPQSWKERLFHAHRSMQMALEGIIERCNDDIDFGVDRHALPEGYQVYQANMSYELWSEAVEWAKQYDDLLRTVRGSLLTGRRL